MPQNSPTNKVHEELEQLIADADDLNDTEPPAPTMSGEKRLSPYNDDDDDNNEDDDGDKDRSTLGDEGNRPDDKIEAGLDNRGPSERQLFVQRIAKRLKLNSTQAHDVKKFSEETVANKLVVLYSESILLSAKVNQLTASIGPASFTLSQEIKDNIKFLTKETFLDPIVTDYKKGETIKKLVVDKIRNSLAGIPKDLEKRNPQAWGQVESRVGYEVTQSRNTVKSVLREDSELGGKANQMKLSALTKTIMARMSEKDVHKYGVESFMRVALFRRVYSKVSGGTFWDTVDDWLAEMVKKSSYEKAMTSLVALDRKTYGVATEDDVAPE